MKDHHETFANERIREVDNISKYKIKKATIEVRGSMSEAIMFGFKSVLDGRPLDFSLTTKRTGL